MNQDNKIKEVIMTIRKELPKTKLHAFGVKVSMLKDPQVCLEMESCDSWAWMFGVNNFGKIPLFVGERLTEINLRDTDFSSIEATWIALENYNKYVEFLSHKAQLWKKNQSKLTQW
jgi:hypothetical protein